MVAHILLLFYFVLTVYCARSFYFWFNKISKIPTLPGALPFVGHAKSLLGKKKDMWDFFRNTQLQTIERNGIAKIWLGPFVHIVVTDPNYAQVVLRTNLDKISAYKIGTPWLGQGLVTSESETWKRHRQLLNPTFNQKVLEEYLFIFNKQATMLSECISKYSGSIFQPQAYMTYATLNMVCQTVLGMSSEQHIPYDNKYKEAVETVLNIFTERFRSVWMINDFLFYWTKLKREQDNIIKDLRGLSAYILSKRKEKLGYQNGNHEARPFKAFIDHLIDLEEENKLTAKEVSDEVNTLFSAGFDTLSGTMTFTLTLVGSFVGVQDKIIQEIYNVIGSSERDVLKEDLSKLVYLEAVIKEVLRLYPVAPIVARKMQKDLKLGNYTIPAGVNVIVGIWGIHRHKSWGEDAYSFKPERWLNPDTLPGNPNAFAAFSIGKRSCIGKNYAMMALKVFMVNILRRYIIKADYTKMDVKTDVLLKPGSAHTIYIEKRKK